MGSPSPKSRLEDLIAATGCTLGVLTPAMGLDLMTRLYLEDPAGLEMLGCTWCKVTHYGPEGFGCQVYCFPRPTDEVTWAQLTLVFNFGPKEASTGEAIEHSPVCTDPAELAGFREFVEESPAWQILAQRKATAVVLIYEDCLDLTDPLFDWWGMRDPSRPIVSLDQEQWRQCDDVGLMLRWFRQQWSGDGVELDRLIQRYYLACCRGIWPLLPHPESRWGVEDTESFLAGLAMFQGLETLVDWDQEAMRLRPANYEPFFLRGEGDDSNASLSIRKRLPSEVSDIDEWFSDDDPITVEEIAKLVHLARAGDDLSLSSLLRLAADFADFAMSYPGIRVNERIEDYRLFLPAPLLREIVGDPFLGRGESSRGIDGS